MNDEIIDETRVNLIIETSDRILRLNCPIDRISKSAYLRGVLNQKPIIQDGLFNYNVYWSNIGFSSLIIEHVIHTLCSGQNDFLISDDIIEGIRLNYLGTDLGDLSNDTFFYYLLMGINFFSLSNLISIDQEIINNLFQSFLLIIQSYIDKWGFKYYMIDFADNFVRDTYIPFDLKIGLLSLNNRFKPIMNKYNIQPLYPFISTKMYDINSNRIFLPGIKNQIEIRNRNTNTFYILQVEYKYLNDFINISLRIVLSRGIYDSLINDESMDDINNYDDLYYKVIQNISNSILFCFYPGTKNTIIIPAELRYLISRGESYTGENDDRNEYLFVYDFTYNSNVLGIKSNTVIQNQTIIGENEINYFIWKPSELQGEDIIERS